MNVSLRAVAFLAILLALPAMAQGTRLLQDPSIGGDRVVFVYAGDLWVVGTDGGDARRLTTSDGLESSPYISPDGRLVAFTGEYDGNVDVYTVPIEGGSPTRLTYHPGADRVRGWTIDGGKVLFASGRDNPPRSSSQLWTIPVAGGMPERLPLPLAAHGAYAPDNERLAYVPLVPAYTGWRQYRGGRTTEIRVVDLADLSYESVPRENSNDYDPMWIGDTLYFISDHHGTMNLYSWRSGGGVAKLTEHENYDIKNAQAGDGVIAYEQAGYLHIYDPQARDSRQLEIHVRGDLPWARPHFVEPADQIRSMHLSPKGKRAVFEARGDIVTVPVEEGDARALTASSDAHDRSPVWSPDGERIAWFSDASGEYALHISDQFGDDLGSIRFDSPSFYYTPQWSPDSTKLLYTDKHLGVWYVDLDSGEATHIGEDIYSHPARSIDPRWSPDSKWIAYCRRLENQLRAIFVYEIESGETHQLTDGLSDAVSPAWDANGKYLYFLASTDYSRNIGWLDMSSYEKPVTRGIYLAVLNAEEASPLLLRSDEAETDDKEEDASEESDEEESGEDEVTVQIDFDGLSQRILALDVPERAYSRLHSGSEGVVFYLESIPNEPRPSLHRYTLEEREAETFLEGVSDFAVSADGSKLLYRSGETFGIVDATGTAKVGDGKLNTASISMKIDPRAEWQQIYNEAWRIKRDFFYDAEMQGADWPAMRAKYASFLEDVAHRADLTYLLNLLIGETVSGHTRTGGGDRPQPDRVSVGLLGADFSFTNGAFRITKIYEGENWNPDLRAPLTEPGLDVEVGDYVLAVNGQPILGPNLYGAFEGTAGKQTRLSIADTPDGNERTVTIVPLASDAGLRLRSWMEANRRRVDELSNGRLAYVYLPDTANRGYTNFNRYYYAQQHKQGVVLDERFNGGGSVADYIVDHLDRPLLSYWATRDGREFRSPNAAVFGPKVMIINEYAGSGGDFLPFAFRKRGIGPLIGKTTWGGLIGVYDYPVLIDGGSVTAPRVAFYHTNGEWGIENIGVPPDIEVDQTPAAFAAGRDPQLEEAVNECLRLLELNPPEWTERPAPIDRTWKN